MRVAVFTQHLPTLDLRATKRLHSQPHCSQKMILQETQAVKQSF